MAMAKFTSLRAVLVVGGAKNVAAQVRVCFCGFVVLCFSVFGVERVGWGRVVRRDEVLCGLCGERVGTNGCHSAMEIRPCVLPYHGCFFSADGSIANTEVSRALLGIAWYRLISYIENYFHGSRPLVTFFCRRGERLSVGSFIACRNGVDDEDSDDRIGSNLKLPFLIGFVRFHRPRS